MPATVQSPMPTQWAGWRASSIPCCFRSRSATMRYSLRRRHDRQLRLCRGLTLALMMFPTLVHAERLKDLADVQGVRSNPLVGYGLVVGLDGSGDQTTQAPFTTQSLKSMLAQLGITVPANVNPQLKNVAAVAISAELPAFAKPGQQIDVTVSSLGNAGSLRGGALLMTPPKDRKSVVWGKSVAVRVDLGGVRILKKKKN